MIPYGRQTIDDEDVKEVCGVLCSDYLTTGPKIEEFERAVADYTGAKYAVSIATDTAALHAACHVAGIGPGDEVITTPITFAASANCVLYCGGRPVFADIDPDTYNIDPDDIRRKITNHTKAIIPVHLAGQPCDMDAIHEIASEYGLTVIEDAAHALGADYHGRKIGGLSDMTTFSFHPVKPITTGEGGMIMTNDEKVYHDLLLFRSHGITHDPEEMTRCDGAWFYQQTDLGFNYRMTDIQAALGVSQMKKLDRFIAARRAIAKRYDEAFSECENIITPHQLDGVGTGWHLYIIQVKGRDRKDVFDELRREGIGVNVHYIPVYMHPYYQERGYKDVHCPVAEEVYSHIISLPIFPRLTEEMQDEVIAKVKKAIL
jgi:UDP-4-amino-4,6-dideoxy-N-acetyl-beta-L-altrosamine transaminase